MSDYFSEVVDALGTSEFERLKEVYKKLNWPVVLDLVGMSPRQRLTSYVDLCCFHKEQSPSLYFRSPPLQYRFKCYGCGVEGDIVMFLILKLKISSLKELEQIVSGLPGYRCDSELQQELPLDG